MFARTLAASAAVLVLATGGAFAQAAAPAAPAAAAGNDTCTALNAMAEADRTKFAQDYLDRMRDEAGGSAAAARTSTPMSSGDNMAPKAEDGANNMAAAPDQGAGGNGQPAANPADVRRDVANDANAAAAGNAGDANKPMVKADNGQPQAAGAADNRNEELDQAANAANNGGQPAPAGGAADDQTKAGGAMANNDANPADVTADDAVKSFKGTVDAAGLIQACADQPEKTFVEIMPVLPAPAGQ